LSCATGPGPWPGGSRVWLTALSASACHQEEPVLSQQHCRSLRRLVGMDSVTNSYRKRGVCSAPARAGSSRAPTRTRRLDRFVRHRVPPGSITVVQALVSIAQVLDGHGSCYKFLQKAGWFPCENRNKKASPRCCRRPVPGFFRPAQGQGVCCQESQRPGSTAELAHAREVLCLPL